MEDGRPFVIEPFQREILADFFGGARELVVLLPKKQGKSSLVASLALWHLLSVPAAEAVIVAAARDQAGIVLKQVTGFIRRSARLRERLRVVQREVRNDGLDGRLRVLASDVDTVDGQLPTFVAVDELHRHRRAELYAVLRDGLGARGGQLVAISTAGDREDTPLGRLRAAAYELPSLERTGAHRRATQAGFVFHEWALDADADVDDIALVKQANPLSSVTVDDLRERHDSPTMQPWQWRRFACGIWAAGEFSAFDAVEWAACAVEAVDVPEGARGPFIGVDLAFKYDTTALVAVFVAGGGWREEFVVQRVERGRRLGRLEWVRDDSQPPVAHVAAVTILEPPGNGQSLPVEDVFDACREMADRWPEATFVVDPLAGGEHLAQRLDGDLEQARVATWSQTNQAMCRATATLAELIGSGRLQHPNDPRLTAHVLACGVRQVDERWRLAKQPGSSEPIDAAIALAMAVGAGVADDARSEPPKEPAGGYRSAGF